MGVLVAPARPEADHPLSVVAATFDGAPLRSSLSLALEDAAGRRLPVDVRTDWGEPDAVIGTVTPERAGRYVAKVGLDGRVVACEVVRVRPSSRAGPARAADAPWPARRRWTVAEEALYAAWVRELFRAGRDDTLAHDALHEVTSDPARNFLWNALGLGEDLPPDQGGLFLQPDCADTPYFLRAYFAWKRGLPMGFRHCSRGKGRPPACGPLVDVRERLAEADGATVLERVGRAFSRTIAWGVHSGNGRVPHESDRSDFYPVAWTHRGIRPGTIYADPYGHVFVVVGWFPPSGRRPGVLYAVDGQPDGSLTRKPFWEGNFLWNPDPALGGSGFKAFRPVVYEDGVLTAVSNRTLERDADAAFFAGPYAVSAQAFYDALDALITPGTRDPVASLEQAVEHLAAAARVRVRSVDNGVRYVRAHPGRKVAMPDGAAIFETQGPWEDYSTPARDLRLLIAIDVVLAFPERVRRRPERFGIDPADVARLVDDLERRRAALLADPRYGITYTRSDGSPWSLTLADLVARREALEVAYHPMDCPEVRWGAAPGSDEASTCDRRAPEDDRRKMEAYRGWFRARRRPPRGDPGPPVAGD
ncbi:MAG: hypothetical protein D6705_06820 [Deltaproteobacteria bacterium]|nr:MAG: hypothetical protein D6705_06820 [Deltaproteobacteria bacterium]